MNFFGGQNPFKRLEYARFCLHPNVDVCLGVTAQGLWRRFPTGAVWQADVAAAAAEEEPPQQRGGADAPLQ